MGLFHNFNPRQLDQSFSDPPIPLGEFLLLSEDDWRAVHPNSAYRTTPTTPLGGAILKCVYNDEASTAFAKGDCVITDTDYAIGNAILSTGTVARSLVEGFAQWAITAGEYGFVLVYGVGYAKGDGSVAAGESIVSHSSNQVDTMASGEEHKVIGHARENDGSAGDAFEIFASVRF